MYDIAFKGLTSDLKRAILSKQEILNSLKSHPNARGYVGNLPDSWIQKIPKEQRAKAIPQIYDAFTKSIKKTVFSLFCSKNRAAESLRKVLVSNKIIKDNVKIKFSKIGEGDFSYIYKIDIGNQSFATKYFKHNAVKVENSFGNMYEQNNALFLNAKESSNWTKFYFANLNEGYMVTQYISKNTPNPTHKINLAKKGLIYIDNQSSNIVNGRYIDYGGLVSPKNISAGEKINFFNAIIKYGRLWH